MNEAAKAYVAERLSKLNGGEQLDFDYGTTLGKEAAEKAIQQFLYDDPESVAPRPQALGQ